MTDNPKRRELTRNQALVHGVLSRADGPLSAYEILDRLREQGFRAPLQVYRALDKLIAFGLVHRLESLNAFVACSHPECEAKETTAFAICDKCGCVTEFADARIADDLKICAETDGFSLTKTTI
ncbi:MAG: transcriptional repressor, partial [Hyphomicrobiales bacterium]|nr:transcriptional repressor [Hyphomicrobiales bacterium]